MKKSSSTTVWAFVLLFFCGCTKDNNISNPNTAELSGNWNFLGFQAETSSTATDDESGDIFTDVTTSAYTTIENGGTVNISGFTMTGNGITYGAVDTTLLMEYENNVFQDSMTTTLNFSIPPTNSVSTFELIGSDSIHFTSQGLIATGSGPASTGAKYSISGNILTMTSNVVVDKIIDTLGETIHQHETAKVVTTLQKQ